MFVPYLQFFLLNGFYLEECCPILGVHIQFSHPQQTSEDDEGFSKRNAGDTAILRCWRFRWKHSNPQKQTPWESKGHYINGLSEKTITYMGLVRIFTYMNG